MRSYEFVGEMTMKSMNFEKAATRYVRYNELLWATGAHMGDIEDYKVLLYDLTYSV